MDTLATIQVVTSAVFVPIYLLISAAVMWLAVSLLGGEGK